MAKAQSGDTREVKAGGLELRRVNGVEMWGIAPQHWVELTDDRFVFRVTFNGDGRLRAFSIETMDADSSPIHTRALRSVSIPEVERAARAAIGSRISAVAKGFSGVSTVEQEWLLAGTSEKHLADLAKVAHLYANSIGQKGWAGDVACELGYSSDTVTKMVKEARKVGLLTPTTRGRSGGSVTDLGWEILARDSIQDAWDEASSSDRERILERDRQFRALHNELDTGQITGAQWADGLAGLVRRWPT